MWLNTFYEIQKYAFVFDQRHIEDRDFLIILYKIEPKNRNCGKLRKKWKIYLLIQFWSYLYEICTQYTWIGAKKNACAEFLNFRFLAARRVKNHNFWPRGYRKNPIKWSKIKKSKIQHRRSFWSQFMYIVCNFHLATIKIEREDRFLVFFQKTFWGRILPKIEHKWPSQPWKSMYKLV